MNRRLFLKSCLSAAAFSSLSPLKAFAAKAEKPNIVLVLADDLGWTDVGCYGSKYYETPNLDRLAKQGMRFTDAYVAAPQCSPARATLIFGQYPPGTGCYAVGATDGWGEGNDVHRKVTTPQDSSKLIPTNKVSIAQALKKNGYKTAIFGKWHLGDYDEYNPMSRGFDDGFIIPKPHIQPPYGPFITRPETESPYGIYQTDFLTDEAIKFVKKNKSQPFFLYLSYFSSVHATMKGSVLPPAGYDYTQKYRLKQPDGKDCIPEFAAKVERCDYNVGKLMDRIDQLGISENTLFIFYSDNGGVGGYAELGDDHIRSYTSNLPLKGGKSQLHEGGIRVPLIVRWPGRIKKGSVSQIPVTSVDFYPTFLDVCNGAGMKNYSLEGVSILPIFEGRQTSDLKSRSIFWHFPIYYGDKNRSGVWVNSPVSAIRKGDFKLLEYFEDGHLELYNVRQDIGEKVNLVDVLTELRDSMYNELKSWQKKTNAFIPQKRVKS